MIANIGVIFAHTKTDPQRSTFYNCASGYRFVKWGTLDVVPGRGRLSTFLNLMLTALICRTRYRRQKIGLLISGSPRIALAVGLVNRLSGARIRHVVWDFNVHGIYRGLKRTVARFALRDVEKIVVYSNHEKQAYATMLNLPADRVLFKLYSGPYLEDARYQDLPTAKEHYVVSAGFSGRNYRHLAAIAAQLTDVPFVLLTHPDAIKGLSFPANVQILGGIPELEYCRYIARAKVFFLPQANKETANGHIAIVQAMSLRTLLVTNLTPGTRDYLVPGHNCLVYDEQDLPAAAGMIRNALMDGVWREEITHNAYHFARDHFTVEQDVEVLHEVVRGSEGALRVSPERRLLQVAGSIRTCASASNTPFANTRKRLGLVKK